MTAKRTGSLRSSGAVRKEPAGATDSADRRRPDVPRPGLEPRQAAAGRGHGPVRPRGGQLDAAAAVDRPGQRRLGRAEADHERATRERVARRPEQVQPPVDEHGHDQEREHRAEHRERDQAAAQPSLAPRERVIRHRGIRTVQRTCGPSIQSVGWDSRPIWRSTSCRSTWPAPRSARSRPWSSAVGRRSSAPRTGCEPSIRAGRPPTWPGSRSRAPESASPERAP